MSDEEPEQLQPLTQARREWLTESVQLSHQHLMTAEGKGAGQWLKARGLEVADIRGARLGLVPEGAPGLDRYTGWLAIPYISAAGHPTSIRFRRPDWTGDASGPKYLGLPDEPIRVFGSREFVDAGEDLYVAEGEFDALILKKVFGHGVGYPGANAWKKYHRRLFEGFRRVYIFGDGDDAGRQFTEQMAQRLRNGVQVYMPADTDVTDYYIKHGAEALKELIA